jgi:hypothetical protein
VVAEALFQEAKFLLSAGKIAQACAKFEASQASSPAPGTLVNLADCFDRLGKTASAWATYRSAAAAAQNAKQPEREKVARDHATAIERKLARVTIAVPPDVAALDPEIRQGGVLVPRASWGMALPVDPGTISVEVRVAGKPPWTKSVEAVPFGTTTVDVTLSAIAGDAAGAAAAPAQSAAEPSPIAARPSNNQRIAAVVVGGVGVVGLGLGTAFGLVRNARLDDAKSRCPNWPTSCPESARDPQDSAKSAGTIATVSFAVGGAALIGAAVLWLTAPRDSVPSEKAVSGVHVVPVADRNGGSLVIGGAW